LTIAYPFFYGGNAAKENDSKAVVIRVEVDEKDLYPDEDFIIQVLKQQGNDIEKIDSIEDYKDNGLNSLKHMGNVAVKPDKIKVLDMKEFDITEMCIWCDPSMSIMNFKILGGYYKSLVNNWYNGREWKLSMNDYLSKG